MAGVQSDLKMIHGVAGAYMACHLYQHKHAVSPSLLLSCALLLFPSLCEAHKQKAQRAASSPLFFFIFTFMYSVCSGSTQAEMDWSKFMAEIRHSLLH